MCTCLTYLNGDFYFGRNLDLDCSFDETVTVTPRNFHLLFRKEQELSHHYAMIGMASRNPAFPLYAEAVNEKGLGMAGLNFPGNAFYQEPDGTGLELASFEVIAWILAKCASVAEAEPYLEALRIVNLDFHDTMPSAPLHWMLADKEKCLVLEAVRDGLKIYENPFGVLTNNPPFPFHCMNVPNYLNLTAKSPENRFAQGLVLERTSQGMGAVGLPGDASSVSRFVRTVFLKWNSVSEKTEISNVSQFFHVLDSAAMVRGEVLTDHGTYDLTVYSCCVNTGTGTYYYKKYDDSCLRKISMHDTDLEGAALTAIKDN